MRMSCPVFILSALMLLCGCHPQSCILEPNIVYTPPRCIVEASPSAFPKLTKEELQTEWGKEMHIGLALATDMDFYRAITAFKRAIVLIPHKFFHRVMQIEYSIMQCYYLGGKCSSALETFNKSSLPKATSSFPAYKELRLMLYDCYRRTGEEEQAEFIRELIEETDPEQAKEIDLSQAFLKGDLCGISSLADGYPDESDIKLFLCEYGAASKSVKKAQILNAVLPGAGYYYVGQCKAAVTSFAINTLFILAAWHFFEQGNIAAGIITTSLESGWYLGGINGAGIAAKEYNQVLYETNAREIITRDRLFPVLMLQTTF